MNTTFMTNRDECEKLRVEVERLRATVADQANALELAAEGLSRLLLVYRFYKPDGYPKSDAEKIADEALAAIEALPDAPDGWKLVPVVPTEEMLFAGHMKIDFDRNDQNTFELEHPSQTEGGGSSVREDMSDAWSAMLAAAPKGGAE